MNPPALRQVNSGLFAEAKQATKLLYSSDARCRYAMEIGAVGLALMLGLSLFGGAPNPGNSSSSAPSSSYNPQPPPSATPFTPTGNPSISQAQLNAIRQQTGGSIITTVPIEPIKVTPAMTIEEAKTTETPRSTLDPYTYTGPKQSPQPAYQDTKKDK